MVDEKQAYSSCMLAVVYLLPAVIALCSSVLLAEHCLTLEGAHQNQ